MSEAQKVALYGRVSTNDQDAGMQVSALRELAGQRGWKIAGEYVDRGVSGSVSSRPALDRLMADARKGKFVAVLCWKFDRFARSVTHLLAALEEFRSLNIDFVSLSESIDTSTPLGRMVFTIVGAVAELERSLIQERVRAGIQKAKRDGKRLGRPRKGFDYRRAVELHEQGMSVRQIAKILGVGHATVHRLLSQKRA